MKKVGIFMFNIFQFGGIERIVSLLVNDLMETNRYEIEVISLFKTSDKPFFELNENVKVNNIFEKPFNLRNKFINALYGCIKFAKNNSYDTIITAGMGYVPISRLAFRGMKHIAWEHSNVNIGKKLGITWIGRNIACRYMDQVVVLTKRDFDNYKRKFPDIINLKQIYNPIEYEISDCEYNIESKKIISCGRLTYQKGFDMLLEVAKIVFTQHPTWEWHIYGDGEEKTALINKIAEFNLQDNIILKGAVNTMEGVYKDYSIFVLSSRYEGFGLVITEAQSYKLPVVSFNCDCGPDELVENNVNGYLIDGYNIYEMAKKICELITDESKRMLFSTNTSLNKEKLSRSVFRENWIELIDNLED